MGHGGQGIITTSTYSSRYSASALVGHNSIGEFVAASRRGMASGHSRSSSCDSSTASSSSAGYIEHLVSRFDTLAGVAIKYGVEVGDIKRMNGLVTDLQMFALKTLKIPLPGRHLATSSHSNAGFSGKPTRLGNHSNLDMAQILRDSGTKNEPEKRPVTSAMGLLRGYYGLSSGAREGAEGTEMAVYKSDTDYHSEDEPASPFQPFSPFSPPEMADFRHRSDGSYDSGGQFLNAYDNQVERHPGARKAKAAASFEPFPRPSRGTVQKVVGCTSIAMEDDLAAEMAALGLPSSFIAGLGHSPSTTTKSRRRKPSSSSSQSRTGTDDKHAESLGATDGNVPSSNFRIRSVRLYTPKYSELDYEIEGCDRLDSSIAAQEERAVIEGDDAANALLCSAGTSEHSEVDVRGGREESCVVDSGDVRWEPVWDEQYQCYYFCNIRTWESTWDPPPGFENYAATTSLAADQQTGSLFGTRERTLGQVCDEGITSEGERDSGSSVGAIPGLVEQSEDKEGRLSTVEKLEAMANYGGEVNGCEDERNDLIVKGSSKEEIQFLLGITNSHIRFGESDESDSGRPGEGQDSGIDWTEISEEMPIQFRKQNDDEEGKDGCEACSGSSQHLVSSFQLKARQRIKASETGTSETGTKKRRVRSLSGDQLDEVKLPGIVGMMNKDLVKYWFQRYRLFTKFDKGVKMDEEGWFSVTPEIIAKHQASRCVTGLVIDAFTGVGGNAIQFAFQSYRVIAIDINPTRIDYARHNAEIYGVSDKIEFIVGDFFQLAPFLKADLVFLSPPWGGPEYLKQEIYDLHTMLKPKDGITLFKVAQSIAPNIALFVPRNVDLNQLQELSWLTSPPLPCEVEQNYVNDKLKAITAYYGDIAGGDL